MNLQQESFLLQFYLDQATIFRKLTGLYKGFVRHKGWNERM